jgi:hypothetical protein
VVGASVGVIDVKVGCEAVAAIKAARAPVTMPKAGFQQKKKRERENAKVVGEKKKKRERKHRITKRSGKGIFSKERT